MASYADVLLAQFDALTDSVAHYRVSKDNFAELLDGALVLGLLSEFMLELSHISAAGARANCVSRVMEAFPQGKARLQEIALRVALGGNSSLLVPPKQDIIVTDQDHDFL